MDIRFSERALRMKGSSIRNKIFENPEIITFAAGKPEGNNFPAKQMLPLLADILENHGKDALQYSMAEGQLKLRTLIAEQRMKACGVETTPDNITLTSGSQEGIEMSAKLFINEGDIVVCEDPSYAGAFEAFRPYAPKFISIPMDENGMRTEELEKVLKENPNVKMIYTIPDFQNPTGIAMSDDRRKHMAELAAKYKVPVIEDSPYGDLIYEGERHPAIKSFDKEGWVILLGSFSKIFCPGLRLGWICADSAFLEKYLMAKQNSNLQCSNLDEHLAAAYLDAYPLEKNIVELRNVYRSRRDKTIECIKKYFPAGIKHTYPHGGFFVWVELKPEINTAELLMDAVVNAKVAFIAGENFFAERDKKNFLRLSYSFIDEETIEEGMKRLGGLLCEKYY